MVGIYCRLFLLVLLMCSCGSSRKAERNEMSSTAMQKVDYNQELFRCSKIKLTDFVKKNMTVRFHWVKFDTDKEPDSEGNYPKMGEGSGEVDFHESESLNIAQSDSTQVESEAKFSHETESEEHSQSESEREETNVFNDMTWLIIATVILLLVIGFVKLLYKLYLNK